MNRYLRPYQAIVEEIKKEDYRILHGKRSMNTAIVFYGKKLVHVDRDIRYTKFGCFVLAHELGHIKDYKSFKFEDYHHYDTYENKPLPIPYIRRLEKSANNFARKKLKSFNIDVSNYKEFDPKEFETYKGLMPWWIYYYNTIRLER